MGHYDISQRTGKVAHELRVPSELAFVHPVINVSRLTKCISYPLYIHPIEGLGLD